MPKVTMVGAGSAVFARQIITDVLAVDSLDEGVFALVDIPGEARPALVTDTSAVKTSAASAACGY